MAFEHEQREARRLLESIESGRMSASDAFALIERSDPALVYLVVTWLRSRYAQHSAAEGVLGRIVEICRNHPETTKILQRGAADPIVAWFEETYEYRELDTDTFIETVVEKLEG